MRGWSLATRLTVWYTATSFCLVAGATWIQYRTLARDLAAEDDQLLLETLAAARNGLLPAGARASPLGPIVRELDAACTGSVQGSPPRLLPPPDCRATPADVPAFRTWYSPSGRVWRIVSARVPEAAPRWLEVVLDRETDASVLRRFREQIGAVLAVALLLAAILGHGLARRGLAPLTALADRVARLDARSLGQRLGTAAAPAEIAALVRSFDALLERLEAAFAALTQFSGDLAHEFRTPVHILRQQAEVILARTRTAEEYQDVLSSMLEELDRLRRMVDDTLFLARAEDPRSSISTVPLRAEAELRGVAEYLDALAAERDVKLDTEASADLVLSADRMLLRRALVNLLTNAIRHTPPAGRITLSARGDGDATIVEVRDTGAGIPTESQARVFDRYAKVPGEARSSADGTGLGLAIVRGIMRLHGGTAALTSEPGCGTRVLLRFPTANGNAT